MLLLQFRIMPLGNGVALEIAQPKSGIIMFACAEIWFGIRNTHK